MEDGGNLVSSWDRDDVMDPSLTTEDGGGDHAYSHDNHDEEVTNESLPPTHSAGGGDLAYSHNNHDEEVANESLPLTHSDGGGPQQTLALSEYEWVHSR